MVPIGQNLLGRQAALGEEEGAAIGAERSGGTVDQFAIRSRGALIERLWRLLDRLPPPPPADGLANLPLLGVPILNRPDLLERLLASLDHPVSTLAIVDNSATAAGPGAVSARLEAIRERGHPLVKQIRIARPFANLGVAASWNLILTSFPEAATALLANNDVQFAPGVLGAALERIDPGRAQFLPLLPAPHAFTAFLLTPLCWDRLGLFDANFHPAYCEDLDYRDRLQASAGVEQLDGAFAHAAMAALNPSHSATLASDPKLRHHNGISYELNRLWYLSERRLRRDPRGSWRRLWLAQWSDDPSPDPPEPS
ncbi:hypothetical protein CPCC7001_1858 [Cyanobium sp. PCC 7001]|uniref:glycosyltransferase family 2 protein n=1 Tax=Cyanobium sp. PCC 7001 TaxID=180281 RepID=UPI0001805422|nr:hypothetical protein [Cyanobium sp. PCC 7001]EDY38979.1 hypothetical protein CPCC7001_1858 [Cyanobium sp. PCC 7001]